MKLVKDAVITLLVAYVSFEAVEAITGNEITALAVTFAVASFGLLRAMYNKEIEKEDEAL